MKRVCAGAALLLFDAALLLLTRSSQNAADAYREKIYPFFLHTLGRLSGAFPGSLAEALLAVLILSCLIWLIRGIRRTVKQKRAQRKFWKNGCKNLFLCMAVLLTAFTLTEGPNYYASSFAEQAGLEPDGYSAEELSETYTMLIERANRLSGQVERDEKGIMRTDSRAEERAAAAMRALGETYPALGGYYPLPKRVWFSQALSLMDITGIYTPFTVEANYNRDMADYNKPFTMCHELSHLKGFMQEDEANFIAFLACEQAEDTDFQYSGAMLGMIYCGNELYARDRERYLALSEQRDPQVLRDLRDNSAYWDAYEGIVARFSQKVNDVYLRVNEQAEGVESYDRVVDLLVDHLLGTGTDKEEKELF